MNLSDRTRKSLQDIIARATKDIRDEMRVANIDRVALTIAITDSETDAEIKASKTETLKIKMYGKAD